MLIVSRLITLLAIVLVTAQPVMACCLTGHPAPASAQMSGEPPWHDASEDMSAETGDNRSLAIDTSDCPGCPDCDTATMQAQSLDDLTILASAAPDLPLPVALSKFTGFAPRRIVLNTGPPRKLAIARLSPVTLKQRLLN